MYPCPLSPTPGICLERITPEDLRESGWVAKPVHVILAQYSSDYCVVVVCGCLYRHNMCAVHLCETKTPKDTLWIDRSGRKGVQNYSSVKG